MDSKISLSLIIVTCFLNSSFSADPRVYGGEKINASKHKHLVKLHMKNKECSYRCSGSIISSNWILTAAHCISPKPMAISVFHFNNGKRKQIAEMERSYIHPNFKDFKTVYDHDEVANDVGLVKTKNKIAFNDNIQPIKLGYNFNPFMTNSLGIISGFGGSEDGAPRTGKVRVYNCGTKTGILCSRGFVRAAQGDSGGPMVIDGCLAGVISASCKYAHRDTNCLTIYANVIDNIKWIQGITTTS